MAFARSEAAKGNPPKSSGTVFSACCKKRQKLIRNEKIGL